MNSYSLCSGETLKFTVQSFGDNIQYSWDFGDGTNSTEQDPEKAYFVTGSFSTDFQVELNISDGDQQQGGVFQPRLPQTSLAAGQTLFLDVSEDLAAYLVLIYFSNRRRVFQGIVVMVLNDN